jgi:predicted kinase
MKEHDLYLIRGLPGAGKTAFVKNLAQEGDIVVAADDFMLDKDGDYKFDASRLDEVHDSCARKVSEAMEKRTSRIFVHNTMTENWEVEQYTALAKQHSYRIFSVIVENRHEHSNLHGTPEETLNAMRKRFDIKL